MRIEIAAIGRMKRGPEQEILARYLDRARKTGSAVGVRDVSVREFVESKNSTAPARKTEEGKQLAGIAQGKIIVALDETGTVVDSKQLSQIISKSLNSGRDLCFLIGGADGLSPQLRDTADHVIALGRMTWPHQIARLLLCEQIYRVMTILSGHPYHRT